MRQMLSLPFGAGFVRFDPAAPLQHRDHDALVAETGEEAADSMWSSTGGLETARQRQDRRLDVGKKSLERYSFGGGASRSQGPLQRVYGVGQARLCRHIPGDQYNLGNLAQAELAGCPRQSAGMVVGANDALLGSVLSLSDAMPAGAMESWSPFGSVAACNLVDGLPGLVIANRPSLRINDLQRRRTAANRGRDCWASADAQPPAPASSDRGTPHAGRQWADRSVGHRCQMDASLLRCGWGELG